MCQRTTEALRFLPYKNATGEYCPEPCPEYYWAALTRVSAFRVWKYREIKHNADNNIQYCHGTLQNCLHKSFNGHSNQKNKPSVSLFVFLNATLSHTTTDKNMVQLHFEGHHKQTTNHFLTFSRNWENHIASNYHLTLNQGVLVHSWSWGDQLWTCHSSETHS